MKKIIFTSAICFMLVMQLAAQSVQVTFHFKPTYTDFTTLRLVGTMNGWNNADNNMIMTDPDGDGEYNITVSLTTGVEYMYKFVMDADWGLGYTDPDNPRINLNDNNNSMIMVTNPMITYLLPRDVNSSGNKFVDNSLDGLPIRAILAFNEGVNIFVFQVVIDGVELANAAQYLNLETKEFYYQPEEPLSEGDHTVKITMITNTTTIVKTATFNRLPGLELPQAPYDFYYDANNSRSGFTGTVNAVAAVGSFNNWNDRFNPMQDDDGDGLWETSVMLEAGGYEYKFKLNGDYWLNDPDQPEYETGPDNNNFFTVTVDTVPSVKLNGPNEQTVFTTNDTTVTFSAYLRPGGASEGINQSSIKVYLDDLEKTSSFDTTSNMVSSDITFNGEGVHVVKVEFTNNEGVSASELFTYGIYTGTTGVFFVDAVNDKHYSNPVGMPAAGNDIQYVKIDETAGHDSLQFTIALDQINDRTRIGIIIANPSGRLIDAPFNLDMKISDWDNGIFAALGAPGNPYENTDLENKFLVDPETLTPTTENIVLDPGQIVNNIFSFKVGTAFLDSLLASWIDTREFYVFSYVVKDDNSGNSIEVTSAEGGSEYNEDPNIYDAAFIRSGLWQSKLFNSFIGTGQRNGPRIAALDGTGRGIATLRSSDISDSLETHGIVISFLTPEVDYWFTDVTVHGTLSDETITSITFIKDGVQSSQPVINGEFSVPVTLEEGDNIIIVKAQEADGFITTSRELVLTYVFDKTPLVAIQGSVDGRKVSMQVEATSPAGLSLSYTWTEDDNNPELTGATTTGPTFDFTVPATEGEYLVKVTAEDTEGNSYYAKKMIFAKNDSVWIAGLNDHASWIDSAVVYEIYPRSFTAQGGFDGIVSRIPDMLDLGINAVWLMPVYEGPTSHGYEITDYYGFESDYGTEADFIDMVNALHESGIKIILDFVVNHTSIQHPFMQNVFEYGEYSPYADFYLWQGEPGNSNYEFYYDWGSLPNLNHNNPDVRKYFVDVAKHWVKEYDIDGFRCDVAWGVEERNNDFWKEWRLALKNIKPTVFLEAEASSSDPVFYQERFDSANDWDLRNRLIETIGATNSIGVMDTELRRSYPYYARPFRFVENHDESRITATYDAARSKLAHTILFMANGVPLIYSGGEVGELTYRDPISWEDPEHMYPYFKRMVHIRKDYIYDPVITRVTNSDALNVYSFSSVSENHTLVTVANMRGSAKSVTLNLQDLPFDENKSLYFTHLFSGEVTRVTAENRSVFPVTLAAYEAAVFYYGDEVTVVSTEDGGEGEEEIVNDYALYQNYPNPFNPTTKISYQIPQSGKVVLKVYDILGREVKTLVNELQQSGKYQINFNASDLASGIYFYRIIAENYSVTKKMLLLK